MSLTQIYATFNGAMLRVVPNLRAYSDTLTNAMVEFNIMSQVRGEEREDKRIGRGKGREEGVEGRDFLYFVTFLKSNHLHFFLPLSFPFSSLFLCLFPSPLAPALSSLLH